MTQTPQYVTHEEMLGIEKQKAAVIWANPRTETLYVDVSGKAQPLNSDVWGRQLEPALNYGRYQKARAAFLSGKKSDLDLSDYLIGDWGKYAEKAFESAGVITNPNFSAVDSLTVFNELLGTEEKDFSLHQAFYSTTSDTLELDVDIFSRFTVSPDVPEGVAPEEKRGSISTVNFDLTKDAAHIAITQEAQMKARHDLKAVHLQNAKDGFLRQKCAKIATELATATDVSLGDWAAYDSSSDHSTRNPLVDIGGMEDTIRGNGGKATVLICDPKIYREFQQNSHIKGIPAPSGPNLSGLGDLVVTNVPGLPGKTLYLDDSCVDTVFYVADKKACMLVNGPMRMGSYVDEKTGIEGTVIREWYQFDTVQGGRIREGTGI